MPSNVDIMFVHSSWVKRFLTRKHILLLLVGISIVIISIVFLFTSRFFWLLFMIDSPKYIGPKFCWFSRYFLFETNEHQKLILITFFEIYIKQNGRRIWLHLFTVNITKWNTESFEWVEENSKKYLIICLISETNFQFIYWFIKVFLLAEMYPQIPVESILPIVISNKGNYEASLAGLRTTFNLQPVFNDLANSFIFIEPEKGNRKFVVDSDNIRFRVHRWLWPTSDEKE